MPSEPRLVEHNAKSRQRFLHRLAQAEIVDILPQQPANQEFQGEIVDLLATSGWPNAHLAQETVDDAVPDRQRSRHEPVAVAGIGRCFAKLVGEFTENQRAELRRI